MTPTPYPRERVVLNEPPGRHELAEADEGKPHDAVSMYGRITNLVMPVPHQRPRHLRQEDDE